MAIAETIHLKEAVRKALRTSQNVRGNNPNKLNGVYLITGYKDVVPSDYDQLGDLIHFFQFPNNTKLLAGSLITDEVWDTGGSALALDVVISEDQEAVESFYTSAVGGGFTNQPSNDGLELLSDDAADTMNATITGTESVGGTYVQELIALTGTSPVSTVRTDWDTICSVVLSDTLTGNLTVREASGNQTITTIAIAGQSAGVVYPNLTFDSELLHLIAEPASSSTVILGGETAPGFPGPDVTAEVVNLEYVGSTSTEEEWVLLESLHIGDLADDTVLNIVTPVAAVESASFAFAQDPPEAINFTGGSVIGTEIGADVSESYFSLRVAAPPVTATSNTVRITYKVFVYNGATSEVI